MLWTWDENKARGNFKKHGVSFDMALQVFEDPLHLTAPDPYPDEERWRTIGRPFPAHPLLLLVVHTDDDGEGGRIVSARKATAHERKAYENAQR
jgi:uncharacterized DUF497 family protein